FFFFFLKKKKKKGVVLNTSCHEKYANEPESMWKCIFGQFRLPSINAKEHAYVLNAAQYDAWQLSWNENSDEAWNYTQAQLNYSETPFRSQMRQSLLFDIPQTSTRNIFGSPCFHHCTSEEPYFWNLTIVLNSTLSTSLFNVSFAQTLRNVLLQDTASNMWLGNCTSGINCVAEIWCKINVYLLLKMSIKNILTKQKKTTTNYKDKISCKLYIF
ncbi:hypothetical protein RFI_06659, partial [Reticulomyxa filosa]